MHPKRHENDIGGRESATPACDTDRTGRNALAFDQSVREIAEHPCNDPGTLARLNGNSAAHGFNRWLGLQRLAGGDGQVEIPLPLRDDMRQHRGYVRGGCFGAVADMARAWAGAVDGGKDVVTSDFTAHVLRPAQGGADRAFAGPILAMLDGAVAQARAALSVAPIEAAKAAALRVV